MDMAYGERRGATVEILHTQKQGETSSRENLDDEKMSKRTITERKGIKGEARRKRIVNSKTSLKDLIDEEATEKKSNVSRETLRNLPEIAQKVLKCVRAARFC